MLNHLDSFPSHFDAAVPAPSSIYHRASWQQYRMSEDSKVHEREIATAVVKTKVIYIIKQRSFCSRKLVPHSCHGLGKSIIVKFGTTF